MGLDAARIRTSDTLHDNAAHNRGFLIELKFSHFRVIRKLKFMQPISLP